MVEAVDRVLVSGDSKITNSASTLRFVYSSEIS